MLTEQTSGDSCVNARGGSRPAWHHLNWAGKMKPGSFSSGCVTAKGEKKVYRTFSVNVNVAGWLRVWQGKATISDNNVTPHPSQTDSCFNASVLYVYDHINTGVHANIEQFLAFCLIRDSQHVSSSCFKASLVYSVAFKNSHILPPSVHMLINTGNPFS